MKKIICTADEATSISKKMTDAQLLSTVFNGSNLEVADDDEKSIIDMLNEERKASK